MAKRRNVFVLGGGLMGSKVAECLAQNHSVVIGDVGVVKVPKCDSVIVDVHSDFTYEGLIEQADIVVGCLPSHLAQKPLQRILKYKKNFVDLSYTTFNYKAIEPTVQSMGVTLLYDCGFAPGLPNLLVGRELAKHKQLADVKIVASGVSWEKSLNKMGFVPSWSLEDLYEEYTRPARFVYGGRIKTAHPLYTPEEMYNDEMNMFISDGLRSMLTLKKQIANMTEYTARWADHMRHVRRMIDGFHEAGVEASKHKWLFAREMTKLCQPKGLDWCILDTKIKPIDSSYIEYSMRVRGSEECSAMGQMTAYTCAAVAEMILRGMFYLPGTHCLETVGQDERCFQFIFEYLKERKIELLEG